MTIDKELLSAATVTGAGAAVEWPGGDGSIALWGNFGTGGSVDFEVSFDGTTWIKLGGEALAITTDKVFSMKLGGPCPLRANVTAGTGISLTARVKQA